MFNQWKQVLYAVLVVGFLFEAIWLVRKFAKIHTNQETEIRCRIPWAACLKWVPIFYCTCLFSSYSLPKPQAAKLKSSINNVRGDLLEKQFYESIKSYFETQNENVLVIHSHKLLGLKSNAQKEKDFIVVNLSFGYILNI